MNYVEIDLSKIEERVAASLATGKMARPPKKSVVPDSFAAWLLESTYSLPVNEEESA